MPFGYNRIVYGIHSICPYRISDAKPYGILKVIGGGTLTMTSEFNDLFGGSNKFAWAVEAGTISAEWTATVKSMPDFMFELFLGASVNTTAASAAGTVTTLTNVQGTSVLQATTGIASVGLTSGATVDLKDGKYVVIAASATTVDVFALTDIEFNKAGATNTLSYQDELLKINASPLTVTSGSATAITGLGVEINGGSGTIGMTIGDSATFQVNSAHDGISEITIGQGSTIFPEHRQLCLAQKRSNGDVFEIDLFRVVASGMPIPLTEQEFSIPELSMRLIQDSDEDKVAVVRAKRGV